MAFTVEDGSQVEGANSYLSVAAADTWHSDRGHATWTGTETVKQSALILATDFIEATYTWSTGQKASLEQGLSWPRSYAEDRHGDGFDSDEVPVEVQSACAYMALEAIAGDLLPALERALASVQAGSVAIVWTPHGAESTRYPMVDGFLMGLVHSGAQVNLNLV